MSAHQLDEVFQTLKELTPVQRWAVGQVLRAFPDEAPPQADPFRAAKARKKQDVVLAFVEDRCEFGGAVTTDEELFKAFKEWPGTKSGGMSMSQNGLAKIISESFPDRVRRRRLAFHNGYRPRGLSGIKLREQLLSMSSEH
jgi:phage/plasmid-associated DNA primase